MSFGRGIDLSKSVEPHLEGKMTEIVIKGLNDRRICDWREWTRPKKVSQWRAGRSAMELARAWFVSPSPRCPDELVDLLATHPLTSNAVISEGVPEHVTKLPEHGEGRNHDLVLLGHAASRSILISVEAKVDEPFGETIGAYLTKLRRLSRRTRAPQRIEKLVSMVFGPSANPDSTPWFGLRYQLLTAVAGTAIEASLRDADIAAFVVHEFRTERVNPAKSSINAADFRAFVAALVGLPEKEIVDGQLYGPAAIVLEAQSAKIREIFIGKAVCTW
jgi:hypothetical protein